MRPDNALHTVRDVGQAKAFFEKVLVAAGGDVVEPRMPIPGIGWYATCAEPGGLKFGLIQADESAR